MTQIEELGDRSVSPGDTGPNDDVVRRLIDRASRLSRADVNALTGAVAWQWQPLALPMRGSLASARTEALAAARVAGRSGAATSAAQAARHAALESPGGQSTAGAWSWAENGLAAVLIGVTGAIVCATANVVTLAVLFGLLAIAGGIVLVLYDSRRLARRRLATCVEAAALAAVVRDLVPPETAQVLRGPWSTVMHD